MSIINYVARTQESMVLNDATQEGNFTNDPYIKENQPKSISCVPLINRPLAKVVTGVLWGLITSDRSAFGCDRYLFYIKKTYAIRTN